MLTIHRSASGSALAAGLAEVLAVPPADPFAADVVAVPAKGVERWLAQRLSHILGTSTSTSSGSGSGSGSAGRSGTGFGQSDRGDGVCANVEFPWPSTILDGAVSAVSPEHAAAVERWAPERARWRLVEVIDASLDEPWCRSLAHHLGRGAADKGRRLAVAARLARGFDEYGASRPQMLQSWATGPRRFVAGLDGSDGDPSGFGGLRDEAGNGIPLPADLQWQAELWRRLREHLGTPAPAELLAEACDRLRAEPGLTALPQRFSVFGVSRLAPARLSVLGALAEHRDVHLWLHHASPALWAAVDQAPTTSPVIIHARTGEASASRARLHDHGGSGVRRSEEGVRGTLRNPLLASMSRDLLELQLLLHRQLPGAHVVHHPESEPEPDTLLNRLKQGLADDTVPEHPAPLDPLDRSVQVHACHGRARQVEVLREVIVGLLADDPTLEPRDILVMCPDVETFAPLVAAVFALDAETSGHPAARIRVRVADRALEQTNALLDVLSQLLDLGTSRITASQVLDLAGLPAVRERFGFDDDELERVRDWMVGTGIRWGLDPAHRGGWQLDGIAQGTWRAGLDRLLLGVAVEGDLEGLGDVVPVDDVDSADIDLAGRVAELVDRLAVAQTLMSGRHIAPDWASGLETAVLSLAAAGPGNGWQPAQLHSELADLAEAAGSSTARFGLTDLRTALVEALAGRPTRSSFRTGTLTVCTLVPMRSVPHRVVCLVGLDDGSFPRQATRDGDDVLARDPWIGERDPRSEDRQLLLDAVCAARERLVITYSGADDRTGASIPPAVPLGELLDALDRAASAPENPGQEQRFDQDRLDQSSRREWLVRDLVTVRHPLQPFDARNFTAGALGRPGPFSFDPLGLAGSLAAGHDRSTPKPFLTEALPARPAGDLELAALQRLLLHPARGFLRQRLQVAATLAEDEPADALPVELDNLERWEVGERLLGERLAGLEPARCIELELRRGLLPPGPLGITVLRQVGREVESVVRASAAERAQPADSHDVDVQLPDGTRLTGTVGNVRGESLLSTTYSRLGPKHRLVAWLNLVALTGSDPSRSWQAVVVGRDRDGPVRSVLGPIPPDSARDTLAELVAMYRAGLREPLPLPLKSGAAYAAQRVRGSRVPAARIAAGKSWLDGMFPGEQSDPEHELLHGLRPPLDVLTDRPRWPDEQGEGWAPDEDDRFGALARRLWDRLIAAERQES